MKRELFCKDCGERMKTRLMGMHFPGEQIRFFEGKMRRSHPTPANLGDVQRKVDLAVPPVISEVLELERNLAKVCDVCLKVLNPGDRAVGLLIIAKDSGYDQLLIDELRGLIEEDHEAGPAEGS